MADWKGSQANILSEKLLPVLRPPWAYSQYEEKKKTETFIKKPKVHLCFQSCLLA